MLWLWESCVVPHCVALYRADISDLAAAKWDISTVSHLLIRDKGPNVLFSVTA